MTYAIPIDAYHIPVVVWDFETLNIIEVNKKSVETYGYSQAEFLNLNVKQIIFAEDIPLIVAAAKSEQGYDADNQSLWRHKKKTGELMYMEVNSYVLIVDGRKVVIAHVFNLTGHLNAKDELAASEERYKQLFQKSPLPMLIYQISNFKILEVNEAAVNHYGYSRDEFLRMTIRDYRPKQGMLKVLNVLHDIPETENLYDFGLNTHIKKDGTLITVEVSGYRLNYRNLDCMLAVMKDVTEKEEALQQIKDNEQKLFTSQQQLALIYNNVKDTIFVISVEKGLRFKFISVNQSFIHTTGIAEADVLDRYVDSIIPEPSLSLSIAKYKEAIATKTTVSWEETTSYATGIKTGIVTITPIFNEEGICVQLIGSSYDITDLKKEERQLKLLESVITNTNDSVLITEAEPVEGIGSRIIYVNDAFTKMTGYTREEIIGKTPYILQGPKSDKGELQRLDEATRQWKSCEVTIINYKKNGEEFWVNFSVTPVADDKGWFTHWIAIERDISEQIAAAELLQASYNERNEILESIGDGFFAIDHNWVVTYWNSSAERIMKKCKEDIVGKDLRDVYPKIPGRVSYDYYEKAFAEKTVQTFTVRTTELDSWFEVVVYPSYRGLSVYFRDINDRLTYVNTIEAQNAKLRSIAWTQSHLTRAHIANILGLMNVLRDAANTPQEKEELLGHLFKAAEKLDTVIVDVIEQANEISIELPG